MKATKKSTGGSSFHNVVVSATYTQLVSVLGSHHEYGGDKTTYEWNMETKNGDVFTVYDWKTYGINKDTVVGWHIGAQSQNISLDAYEEIIAALSSTFETQRSKVINTLDEFICIFDEFVKEVSTKNYRGTAADFESLRGVRERIKTYTEITEHEKTSVSEWKKNNVEVIK